MVSTFGWFDTDSEQRRKMLEAVDLFKEQGTVDELGIGSIRDALAGALFPGISYVHTRLRHVLFIPWLLQRASFGTTPTEMSAEFRRLEYRLITSLLAGDEHTGVIGNRARDQLRRMPSGIYWSALGEWGIRTADSSIEGFFRRQHDYRALASRTLRADDPEARESFADAGLDPHPPQPPADLLKAASFTLRAEDEQYLSDRIATMTKGSMLSWLIYHQPQELPDHFWDLDNLADEAGLGERDVRLEQLGTYSDPRRDVEHEKRIISIAHLSLAANLPETVAGTDAADASWVPVDEAARKSLAFDQTQILEGGIERARSKLEYSTLATSFLVRPSRSVLRSVYEAVRGVKLDAANFYRKVTSPGGFVEATGEERRGRGRRAALFTAGVADSLGPPLAKI